MAGRPLKEGLDYFSHDTDAVNDEKIEALRMLYGNDGYAFYFITLERIYRTSNFELCISDAEIFQILCKKCGVDSELMEQMINTAIKFECFDKEAYEKRGVLTSNGIKKRAKIVTDKRVLMQKKYQESKGEANNKARSEISDTENTQENSSEIRQSKEKKSKGKKSNKDSSSKVKTFDTSSSEYILADKLKNSTFPL